MFADQALRCECGYEVRASDEAGRVDEVRRHASETHGIAFSADDALAVLLRLELDGGVLADLAMVEATARGKDEQATQPAGLEPPRVVETVSSREE